MKRTAWNEGMAPVGHTPAMPAKMTDKQALKRKRGRPSTNFDKRAYQREYMRRRRAKAKAEKGARDD